MTKYTELTDALFNGQAFRRYNNTGTHLLDMSCKITSSDACTTIKPGILADTI